MRMVFHVKLSGPVLLHRLRPMRMVVAATFSVVLGQVELPLPQLHEEAALLHLAAPPVQPLHGVIVLPRGRPVEERLGVDAPAGRLLELDARRGLELAEVPQDRALRARHVGVRVVVLEILIDWVTELVALAPVVAVVAVRRHVVGDLLADGDRRLRASNKLNSEQVSTN
jgi:hypothetical protein